MSIYVLAGAAIVGGCLGMVAAAVALLALVNALDHFSEK